MWDIYMWYAKPCAQEKSWVHIFVGEIPKGNKKILLKKKKKKVTSRGHYQFSSLLGRNVPKLQPC